ncbi:GCN5-related N-acetyltransferase [Methylocella silvestris BL2]|uniref:GCN5-related N-acetyltransferase n=1 Tax=Methylocella silvestris (strain DSM 15510 / CIP 108128 / LMG 27833 / NCIMB 13906 / BL2) TaxID=395965 RepID=B8EQC9_METSB|nr:GNAT family N-acetyltransferase [Methylocella silvestris]ACK52142.1 GCN5-related N-acetyltransferase [Methylocella silvestris BL2]
MTAAAIPPGPKSAPAEVHLRPRAPGDFDALAALWIESWTEAMPAIDFSARRDWLRAHLDALEAAGGETICAFDRDGRALGFVTIDPRTGYLDQIAVAAQAKGSGVAGVLLDAARRASAAPLSLEVNQDNPRALSFYRREGFVTAAEGVNPMSGLKTWRLQAG